MTSSLDITSSVPSAALTNRFTDSPFDLSISSTFLRTQSQTHKHTHTHTHLHIHSQKILPPPLKCSKNFNRYFTPIFYAKLQSLIQLSITLTKSCHIMHDHMDNFYTPQLYRQVLLRRVLAMGILSVCLSLCLSRPSGTPSPGEIALDSGSSPYDSLESLVSYEVTWCHWVRRFPSNEGIKEGYPP